MQLQCHTNCISYHRDWTHVLAEQCLSLYVCALNKAIRYITLQRVDHFCCVVQCDEDYPLSQKVVQLDRVERNVHTDVTHPTPDITMTLILGPNEFAE